ncbi:NAD(P)H-binding protein [Rhodococcus triatomae]|uniref:Uncharacterized conserved protein YbjT, contains NAD(P)-binding and DUF2867 domains n=1 Tax=Rhodococcus triatomae TaxID=300028 RepID=A0A1G8HQ48_9NOCA|nr:NAD(P)H-binding protein [Rhodococcus triatomae]QNG20849.1 NAD(P)H-binding protein [Rhodococcus triatomae]QNG23236.1 NAD(P)H-binding protein [Rhodococcus triatomae]SDI08775.1 Uncharacterized conserved protein YbjT, contains NAD(P)-binding and DUF2867 domains [Rhodococcus triatomae]
MTIAVTGATGTIGGLVLRNIGHRLPVRLVGRDPAVLAPLADAYDATFAVATYEQGGALVTAFDDVDTVFFVSGRESAHRREEHRTVVESAHRAGVRRIVYLSFLGAAEDCTFTFGRDHHFTERDIRDSGLAFTFLRDSWYQSMLPAMVDDTGVIRGPAGEGRVGAVAPDDVAASASAVLASADGTHDGATYRITGPEAFTLTEAAEVLSRVTGRRIRFVDETLDEAYASRAHYGAPAFEVDGWVTSYAAVAAGELSPVSDDVARLTGNAPIGFEDYLERHPDSWARLLL